MANPEITSKSLDEMSQQIRDLTAELESAHNRLIQSEQMATLGEMMAGIAHEIRDPLNLINNFAALSLELLFELEETIGADEQASELINDLKRNASVIVNHGKRADVIVQKMMRRAGAGTGRHEETDVNSFVEEFLRISYQSRQASHEGFHCDVTRNYGEDVDHMLLNRQQMGRVLLNIFANAFDTMEQKATVSSQEYEPRLTVSTELDGSDIEIRISDNGEGVTNEIGPKIFEPFFTTKDGGAGSGLGLSLSYDIVAGGHHGTLTFERNRDTGTTFVIRIPLNQSSDE